MSAVKTTKKKKSRTDWPRLNNQWAGLENIDTSDIPELDDTFWSNAQFGSPLKKIPVSVRFDQDLLKWFKNQGPNYQTRMHSVLRSYMRWCMKESTQK